MPYSSHTSLSNAVQHQTKPAIAPLFNCICDQDSPVVSQLQYFLYHCACMSWISMSCTSLTQSSSLATDASVYISRAIHISTPENLFKSGCSRVCSSLNNHHQHHSAVKCWYCASHWLYLVWKRTNSASFSPPPPNGIMHHSSSFITVGHHVM